MRALEPNDVLAGRYRVERQIGAGGMGAVYLAQHLRLETPVAIKTCHLGLNVAPNERAEYLRRFKREAMALSKLKHTNIVGVLDYDVDGDTPFLVMEYFKGQTILAWGEARRPTPRQWLKVFRPLFEALAVAHRAGVVHRDIKGPNVLVRGEVDAPDVMLIDWGIALDESQSSLTQQQLVLGSPGCIDPARFGGAAYTPKSDIYAMGALMYWALTGQPAIVPKARQSKAEANAENDVAAPHTVQPTITGDLEEFLLGMLETAPENRPPSALACVAIIDDIARDIEVQWESLYAKYPAMPFVPASDVKDEVAVAPANAAGTVREGKFAPRDESARVDVPDASIVHVDAVKPNPDESVVARFDRNVKALQPPKSSKRGRVVAIATAVACTAVSLALLAQHALTAPQTSSQVENDAKVGQLVTPDDIERATKAGAPAIDQAIRANSEHGDSLGRISPDIRARYATSPEGAAKALVDAKGDKTHAKPADEAKQPPLTLGIVAPPPDATPTATDRLTIPHGTRVSAYLLDLLDTSNSEPVRAELRSTLRVDERVVIPVGAVLMGSASLRDELRANATFTRVVFRDGREFPIRAEAILKDGREGIAGGQFEYGDGAKKKEGTKVVADVAAETAIDVASLVLPGADALSRSSKRAIASESGRLRDGDVDPRKRDRMLVNRGTELLIQFRTM